MTVAQQATRILEVWNCGNANSMENELFSAEQLCRKPAGSALERERRELLASIVDELRSSISSDSRSQPVSSAPALLLRHLGASSRIQ